MMKEIKVLMVDDEEVFAKTVAERMRMREVNSEVVLNGEQALEFLEGRTPDVMVLDLKMPGIEGMEVLRRVRETYPQVQVIILTGHGSEKDETEARRLGAADYLKKPVAIETLMAAVKNAYKKEIQNIR
jgi:DNA-binding response OmpR family regulator